MNFLAHLFLSKNDTRIMIGNLIADHIKGSNYKHFPQEIQNGIILHRNIDTFTDTHAIVKSSKRRLHSRYGHFSGIIIDIFYDYFLAKNWRDYSAIPLNVYSKSVYQLLEKNNKILPEKTQEMLPYMKRYDWLYNYQFLDGIENVLIGMNKRTQNKSQMHLAIEDLKMHENELEQEFTEFFRDLYNYVEIQTQKLINS